MLDDTAWQIVLTTIFALTGAYYVRALWARPAPVVAVGDLAHLLMSAAMIAMSWSWGAHLPTWLQVVVFGAAALWYVWCLVGRRGPDVVRHHGGPLSDAYHAVMMGSMVWMAVRMSGPGGGGAMDMGSGAMGSMGSSGTDMAGAHATSTGSMADTGAAGAVDGALAAFYGLAAIAFAVRLVRRASGTLPASDRTTAGDDVANLVMAAGMGIAFWLMR